MRHIVIPDDTAERVVGMIKILLLNACKIEKIDVGSFEFHFSSGQLKAVLKQSLPCKKLDK